MRPAKLKNILTLFARSTRRFSQEEEKKGFMGFIKSAWNQTFPNEEDLVRAKYQKAKEQKRYTK